MKECILYILVFKDEPLIKVGFSVNAYVRAVALGASRFDFHRSYIIKAKDKHAVGLLEKVLKTFFAENRSQSVQPMRNGNSEIFHSSILPDIIAAVTTFQKTFSQAEIETIEDISTLIPVRKKRAPGQKAMTKAHAKSNPVIQGFLLDLETWCSQEYGRKSAVARLLGVKPSSMTDWSTHIPSWETGQKIEAFVKKTDQARRRAIGESVEVTKPPRRRSHSE